MLPNAARSGFVEAHIVRIIVYRAAIESSNLANLATLGPHFKPWQKFVDSEPFIEPLEVSFFDQM